MVSERGRGNITPAVNVNKAELRGKINTGEAAKALLDNVTLNKALTNMENNAINALKSTKISESDLRESLYLTLKVVDSFKKELATFINIGATANHKLENNE